MEIITALVAWAFLTFAFWLIIPALFLISYFIVCTDSDLTDISKIPLIPAFLLGIAIYGVSYKYALITSWAGLGWFLLIYAGIGFAISVYKWIEVLLKFPKKEIVEKIVYIKSKFNNSNWINLQKYVENEVSGWWGGSGYKVECNESQHIFIYPDWRKHPIASWWIYWPLFSLSIPFEWGRKLVNKLTELLKDFWNNFAKQFAAKG